MPDLPPSIASFTVRGGPLDGRRLDADEAVDEILIGSDSDCRFCLELPGVSPIHARVWMDLDGVTVHDTHSPRGVYVNDNRVAGQAPLRDRDILWLGAPGDESSVMIECRIASATAAPESGTTYRGDANALADLVDVELDRISQPDGPAGATPAEPIGADALADLVPADSFGEPVVEMSPEPPSRGDAGSAGLHDLLESAPAAPAPSGFDFYVEEPAGEPAWAAAEPAPEPAPEPTPAPLDDLIIMDTAAPAPVEAAPAPPVAETAAADDEFFVQDEPEPQNAPDPAGDGFFVEESPPAVTFDEPFVLEEDPAVAPVVTPPSPPPPAPAPPAATPAAPSVVAAAVPPPVPRPRAAAASSTAPQPAEPPPVPKRKPATPPPAPAARPASPRPQAASAAAGAAPRAGARAGLPPIAKYGAMAAVAVLVLGGGAFFLSRGASAPKLEGASPSRVAPGQTLTLTGRDFAPNPQGNAVRFEGRPARVLKASATELQVEVPDVPTAASRPSQVPVTVTVGGRESAATQVTVYQSPRIHGLSPSVAMPGEEVTLAGTGWGLGAKVRFGSIEAPVVSTTPTALRVRVPEGAGGVGTSIPVVVSMGSDASSPFPFLLGRLPLVSGVEPRTASAGDLVVITGRGFHVQPGANAVTIGGARALVVSSSDADVKAAVPRAAAPSASAPVEVKVDGLENVAQATLTVSPPLDPVDFGFAAEPFVDAAGHEHAVLTTGLGPAFVMADSGGRSAAERAVEAARRLNAAATPLRASRGEDLEVRGVDGDPVIVLMGKSDPILQVTEEDAAAYNEDWTRLGGKGGPVTRARLALWWGAVARDLVLMLVRGETPRHTAGLAPEGKVLVDLFDAARQTGRFGVPLSVVESARPGVREALRVVGLRVPSAVAGPPAEGGAAPAPAAAGAPALRLDGVWTGAETDSEGRKNVTVRFSGTGGSLSYQRALSVSVPLTGVGQPRKGAVGYSVKTAAGTRFYLGRWDGEKITGTIFSDAANTFPIGSFELRSER